MCVGREVCSSKPLLNSVNNDGKAYPTTTHFYNRASDCVCAQNKKAVLDLDDQLWSLSKELPQVCSKSQSTLANFRGRMISAKQKHASKLGGVLHGRTQLYLPVNNFPTSHSRTGAFDFSFMRVCFTNAMQAKRNCTWQSC